MSNEPNEDPRDSDYYKGEIRGEDRDPRGWLTTTGDRINVLEESEPQVFRLIYLEQFIRLFRSRSYESFTIYNSVIVLLTSTHDVRSFSLINELPASIRYRLFAVQAHKGNVSFYWKIPSHAIPVGFQEGDGVPIPANPNEQNSVIEQNDYWIVDSSEGYDKWAFSKFQSPDGTWYHNQ